MKSAALQAGCQVRQPGDVATGAGETFDDARPDGIADRHEDYGDTVGSSLARLGGNRAKSGDEHVGLHPDKIGREARQQFGAAFGGAIDEVQVLSFDIAKFAESTQKLRHEVAIFARKQSKVGNGE